MNERTTLEGHYAELMWRRAASDPAWFMRELMWVQSQRPEDLKGRVKFGLFDYQARDLEEIVDNQFVTILKARQLGLSTLVAGYALWLALFRPGAVVVWISNNQENANKAIAMLDMAWHFLPDWAKLRAPEREGDAASEKVWVHPDGMRSRIKARAGTKTAAVGETATLVVLDEFALVDPPVQDDLYRSAGPTTDAGGKLVIISTARGRHNRFARMYVAARRGENRFQSIFHPWYVSRFVNRLSGRPCTRCRGRRVTRRTSDGVTYCPACVDTSAYEAKRADFPDQPWLHRAEYPSTEDEAFRESGRPRFPWLPTEDACPEFPYRGRLSEGDDGLTFVEDPTGSLRLAEEARRPEGWRRYVLSVDPSTGIGGDFTAMCGGYMDADGLPVRVAFWHSNTVEQVDAAREAALLGRWLSGADGPAKVVVEKQGGYGDSVVNELVSLHYPNMYRHRYTDHRRRTRQQTYGMPMQWTKRPLVIDRLASFLQPLEDGADVPKLAGIDPLLLGELESFVRTENGKVQADTGCHDDLVMATSIWLWVLADDTQVATPPPCGEGVSDDAQRYDLSHVFDEVEAVRRAEERQMRDMQRAWRSMSHTPFVMGGGRRR